MEEAVVNWGNKYYPKTTIDNKERGAIIKSIVIFGKNIIMLVEQEKDLRVLVGMHLF